MPHKFQDASGNEWQLCLTYPPMKRMRQAGLDPFEFVTQPKTVEMLMQNAELLVRILWSWLEPELDRRQITQDAFAELLGGEAIAEAFVAVRDEVLDFLSKTNPAAGTMLRKAA